MWGPLMLIPLLLGTGISLTLRLGGIQVLRRGAAQRYGLIKRKEAGAEGSISQFQALATAISSCGTRARSWRVGDHVPGAGLRDLRRLRSLRHRQQGAGQFDRPAPDAQLRCAHPGSRGSAGGHDAVGAGAGGRHQLHRQGECRLCRGDDPDLRSRHLRAEAFSRAFTGTSAVGQKIWAAVMRGAAFIHGLPGHGHRIAPIGPRLFACPVPCLADKRDRNLTRYNRLTGIAPENSQEVRRSTGTTAAAAS